jgi:prefoldin alpha subunit
MASEKELQEKVIAYRIIESRIESMLRQREALVNKLMEIETTLRSIEEVERTDEELLFSPGSEVHFIGKVTDRKKVIVEIGANTALEKTFEEGKEILKKRKAEIENLVVNIEKNLLHLSSGLQELESQLNEMAEMGKEAG